jgi:hypothetical protein
MGQDPQCTAWQEDTNTDQDGATGHHPAAKRRSDQAGHFWGQPTD